MPTGRKLRVRAHGYRRGTGIGEAVSYRELLERLPDPEREPPYLENARTSREQVQLMKDDLLRAIQDHA